MHRTLAVVVLFGLSLLIQSQTVFADSTPYPARTEHYCGRFDTGGIAPTVQKCGYPSGELACRAMNTADAYLISVLADTTVFISSNGTPTGGYGGGGCYYTTSFPQTRTYGIGIIWTRSLKCDRGGLVYDHTPQVAMCECVAGTMFPPGGLIPGGPPCVLDTCPIPPLESYSPDPHPALIEELSPRTQAALSCLRAAIGGQGGSSSFTSGYRPAPYNAHLIAVWDKLQELNNYKGTADCSARRAEVMAEINTHKMKVRPDPTSPHTFREAFDLSSSLSRDVTNGLAINCGAFSPYPLTDRPHFEPVR